MWISRQKFTELKERVDKLDPEKIVEKCQKLSEEWLANTANKVIDEKTKDFSSRFHAIQSRLTEQDKKIEKFVSSTQKITKIVLSRISDVVKEILELIEKTPE